MALCRTNSLTYAHSPGTLMAISVITINSFKINVGQVILENTPSSNFCLNAMQPPLPHTPHFLEGNLNIRPWSISNLSEHFSWEYMALCFCDKFLMFSILEEAVPVAVNRTRGKITYWTTGLNKVMQFLCWQSKRRLAGQVWISWCEDFVSIVIQSAWEQGCGERAVVTSGKSAAFYCTSINLLLLLFFFSHSLSGG